MNFISTLIGVSPFVTWFLLSAVILLIEVLVTSGFFLSFSLSASIVAVRLLIFPSLWAGQSIDLLVFAVLGVIFVQPFRSFLRNRLDKTPDINEY